MVTVAIRRIHLDDPSGKTLLDYLDRDEVRAFCRTRPAAITAKDAVLTAKLARERSAPI